MINIAINGFGRIGRAIARLILKRNDCRLVLVNELDPDIRNLIYLLKYDSIYGRLPFHLEASGDCKRVECNGCVFSFLSIADAEQVPWGDYDVDVLIDATGVKANVVCAPKLLNRGIPKVVITHSPAVEDVDATIVFGVNEQKYDHKMHHVISSSICDATAIAPVLFEMEKRWGIESCFVTTLHPWLSYQNLADGPLSSVSNPGHFWKDYALGRNSVLSLIPKDTTAATAILKVMPQLEDKLDAISFRVPTGIVSASDLTILVKQDMEIVELKAFLKELGQRKPRIFEFEEESLVSIDFLGTDKSTIIDANRIKLLSGRMVKMVIWYDNEWGYSNRVLDIARLVGKGGE